MWNVSTFANKSNAQAFAKKNKGSHLVTLNKPPRTKQAKEYWEIAFRQVGAYSAFHSAPYAVLWKW